MAIRPSCAWPRKGSSTCARHWWTPVLTHTYNAAYVPALQISRATVEVRVGFGPLPLSAVRGHTGDREEGLGGHGLRTATTRATVSPRPPYILSTQLVVESGAPA
jgi:hypothetical protein